MSICRVGPANTGNVDTEATRADERTIRFRPVRVSDLFIFKQFNHWARRDSNPHAPSGARDFKSLVSAIPPLALCSFSLVFKGFKFPLSPSPSPRFPVFGGYLVAVNRVRSVPSPSPIRRLCGGRLLRQRHRTSSDSATGAAL